MIDAWTSTPNKDGTESVVMDIINLSTINETDSSLESNSEFSQTNNDLLKSKTNNQNKSFEYLASDYNKDGLQRDICENEFIQQMEEAWTYTQSTLDEYISEISNSNEGEVNDLEENVMKVIRNETSQAQVGPETLEILKKIRRKAAESLSITKTVKMGNRRLLRQLYEQNLMCSGSNVRHEWDDNGTCSDGQIPLGRLDFDKSTTPRRYTRSMGCVQQHPHVQPITLEYKKNRLIINE